MTFTVSLPRIQLAPGSQIMIPNVSRQYFANFLDDLGEKRRIRLAYYQGLLEIMAPSALHEKPNRLITDIIKTILECQGQDWEDYGSMTLKRPNFAGIEPDTCFYIQNAARMREGKNLDLSQSPPTDLAIEGDLTSRTVIQAYGAIQVPEIWIFANEKLTIYLYDAQDYQESQQSQIFSDLPMTMMIPELIQTAYRIGARQMLAELKSQLSRSR